MKATIKDIAKLVGVSPSTVSRVINGTASISDETKEKINKAMKELDYHPNSFARSLVNGNTFTIGLVIDAGNKDAFSNAFFIQSVTAIEMVAQSKGYNVLITNDAVAEEGNTIKSLIQERKVDGIILPVQCMKDELVAILRENQMPFVVMGETVEENKEISWVDVDNRQGAELALEHLFAEGYQHPMLLVENRKTVFEQKRMKGFTEGCGRHGIKDAKIHTFQEAKLQEIIKEIKSGERNTDSFICTNNVVAFRTLRELQLHGIDVPGQVGVITFDNYPLAEYMTPALSAIDIDTYQLGEMAANMLFQMIKTKEGKVESQRIETRIIERESTRKK